MTTRIGDCASADRSRCRPACRRRPRVHVLRHSTITQGNWIPTEQGKGWFVILRLYSPLQPFFDKSWRPTEIEPVS
jgi:hypothetical protein